jgi:2,3-bisphosphoglycerate-dependent phosphoglycerate mutase
MTLHTLFLVRHGETAWNAEHRWQGHTDIPLMQSGIEQARRLAAYLRPTPIAAIYASDLQRASQTAAIIAEAQGVEVQTDARWREMNAGIFQGKTHDEITTHYADEFKRLNENWLDHVVEGGESRRQMRVRILAALDDVLANTVGERALVASHGGSLRLLVRTLFPDHPDAAHKPIENTSLTTLGYADGAWTLHAMSETPHLKAHVVDGEQEAQ